LTKALQLGGFAHVFDQPDNPFADSILPHSTSNYDLTNYDESYEATDECYEVRAVTNSSNYLLVGGSTTDTNINLGGGTLPGGGGFIAGYSF